MVTQPPCFPFFALPFPPCCAMTHLDPSSSRQRGTFSARHMWGSGLFYYREQHKKGQKTHAHTQSERERGTGTRQERAQWPRPEARRTGCSGSRRCRPCRSTFGSVYRRSDTSCVCSTAVGRVVVPLHAIPTACACLNSRAKAAGSTRYDGP